MKCKIVFRHQCNLLLITQFVYICICFPNISCPLALQCIAMLGLPEGQTCWAKLSDGLGSQQLTPEKRWNCQHCRYYRQFCKSPQKMQFCTGWQAPPPRATQPLSGAQDPACSLLAALAWKVKVAWWKVKVSVWKVKVSGAKAKHLVKSEMIKVLKILLIPHQHDLPEK